MAIGIGVSVAKCPTYARMTEFNQFYARVIAAGGTIADAAYLKSAVLDYRAIAYLSPSLYTFASGRKAGTLYSLVPTDGSGDFSVTRSGDTAMELNKNGYWQPAAANVPRFDYVSGVPMLNIEAAATNLIARARSFAHSDWTKSGASIQGDPSTAGAELHTSALSNGNMTSFTAVGLNGFDATSNGAATHRCGSADEIVLVENGLYKIEFDQTLNSGTQPSVGLADSVGGTARSATQAAVAGHNLFYLLATASTTGVVQFVNSSTATDYAIRNFTIKKVTGYACPFVTSAGVNTYEGYKLVEGTNNGAHYAKVSSSISIATGQKVISVFAKYDGTRRWILLSDDSVGFVGNFDLLNGVVGAGNATRTITSYRDGWYKCEIMYSSSVAAIPAIYLASANNTTSYLGDGTSGIYICHAQLEAGAVATSPVYGAETATQTRNRDNIIKTNIGTLIGQTQGTIFMDIYAINKVNGGVWIILSKDTGNTTFIQLYTSSAGAWRTVFNSDDGSQTSTIHSSSIIATGRNKVAVAYKNGEAPVIYVNGLLVAEITGALNYTYTLNNIYVGQYINGTQSITDHVNVVNINKTRLSNAQLAALTTL